MADVNITTRLTGTDQVQRGLRGISASVAGFARSMSRVTGLLGAVGLGISAAGFVQMSRQVVDTADQIGKLSDRLGLSTEALSELRVASKLSGLEFRTTAMAVQRMTRRVSEAAIGSGEAQEAIKELGLQADQLNKLAPEEQLKRFADALSRVPRQADRVRLAMRLFDSEGVAMLQMLKDGSEGLEEFSEIARRTGVVFDEETVQSAVDLKDAMAEMSFAFEGLMLKVLTPIIPVITDWIKKLNESGEVAETVEGFIENLNRVLTIGNSIFQMGSLAVRGYTIAVETLAKAYVAFFSTEGGIKDRFSALIEEVEGGVKRGSDVAKGFLENAKKAWKALIGEAVDGMKKLDEELKKTKQQLEEGVGKPDIRNTKAYKDAYKALEKELQKVQQEARETAVLLVEETPQDLKWQKGLERFLKGLGLSKQTAQELEEQLLHEGAFAGAVHADADALRDRILAQRESIAWLEVARAEIVTTNEAYKTQTEALDEFIEKKKQEAEAIKESAEALLMTHDPQHRMLRAIDEYDKLLAANAITQQFHTALVWEARDAYRAAIEAGEHLLGTERELWIAEKEREKGLVELSRELENAVNPMWDYTDAVRTYIQLLNRGWISQEAFNEAVKQAAEVYNDAVDALNDVEEEYTRWQQAMLDASQGFASEFTEQVEAMLAEGKASWKDFRDSIFSLFRKALLDAFITQPLLFAIREIIKSLQGALDSVSNMRPGGGGGSFMSTIGSAIGSIFGGAIMGGGPQATPLPAYDAARQTPTTTPEINPIEPVPIITPLPNDNRMRAPRNRPPLRRATGGVVPLQTPAIVGEEGPELLLPETMSRFVVNNKDLESLFDSVSVARDRFAAAVISPTLPQGSGASEEDRSAPMSTDNMRMDMVGVLGRIGKMLGMRGNAVAAAGIGRITEMIREKVVSSPNFKPAAPSIVNNATTVNNITTPVAPIGPSPVQMAASAATQASEALTPAVALAGGGRLPSGFAGIVGEMGPEFIAPANVNRDVTPNSALGGQTVIVNQNFSAGVTHRELASILPRMKQETISAVIEAKRRGGQFSRTF